MDESEGKGSLLPLSSAWVKSTVLAPRGQAAGPIKPFALQNAKGLTGGMYLHEGGDTGIKVTHHCTTLLTLTRFPDGADLPLPRAHRLLICVRV